MDDGQRTVQGWSLDGRYQPLKHQTPTARFESLTPQSPHHVKVYLQAFTPLAFHDAPLVAVKTLLSFDVLSIPEDDVLRAVLEYVCKRLGIPASSGIWTPQQRKHALFHLQDLVPLIRYLSLSTDIFLHVLEPLGLLSQPQLINKYRFDALSRFSSQKLTFSAICSHYRSAEERRQVIRSLRGVPMVLESPHPYRPEKSVCIQTNSWAPRILVEFDRRTDILPGTSLELSTDSAGFHVLDNQSDHQHWLREGTIKSMVLDHETVYVHVKPLPSSHPRWGWKLFAIPLVYESDYDDPTLTSDPENEVL